MAHEAGKGSRPRPFSVSKERFDSNWEAIFGKKDRKETTATDTVNTEECLQDIDDSDLVGP